MGQRDRLPRAAGARFAIENALHWLRDYRFDGLRFDAVNHIVSAPGEIPMLHDLSIAAGKLAAKTGRHIHLVLENGDNRASLLDAAPTRRAANSARNGTTTITTPGTCC